MTTTTALQDVTLLAADDAPALMAPKDAALLIAEHGDPQLLASGYWARLTHPAYTATARTLLDKAVAVASAFEGIEKQVLLATLDEAADALGLRPTAVTEQALAS